MNELVCGGVVGDSEALCVQTDCTVAKHKTVKYGINKTFSPEFKSSSDMYVMMQLNPKTVHPKYSIPAENFSDNNLVEILEFHGTSNDLETLVNNLLALIQNGHNHPWSDAFETVSGVKDNNRDQQENESPIKKLDYDANVDSWAENGDFDSSEMKLKDKQFENSFPETARFINSCLETVRNNSIVFNTTLTEVTKTLNSVDIARLDYRIAGLRHQVGFRPDESSRISAFESIKTLTDGNESLEEKQNELERNLDILEEEVEHRSMSDKVIATMEKLKINSPATKAALTKNITNVWQKVRGCYDRKISNLHSAVSNLEAKVRNHQAGRRASTQPAPGPGSAILSDLQREISDLKVAVNRHSNMLESGQVISNGIVITGRSNLETIIQNGLKPSTKLSTGVACFVDCSTLLHYAAVKCNNDAQALKKLLIKSPVMHSFMEVVQEAASDVQIPILLMGKAKSEEFNVDRRKLPAMPIYENFDEGYAHGGLKSTIEIHQGIAHSETESNIDDHLKGQANQIAKSLLYTMNNFITTLLNWMQSKYTSLKATMGEECKDTSWLFVTHAVVSTLR